MKNIINITVFSLLIFGFSLFWIFSEKPDMIMSERRETAKMPPISQIFGEEYSGEFEKHMLDTFPAREIFRKVNATFRVDFLKQKDSNGIYKSNGHLAKTFYPLDEDQVLFVAKKINTLREKHFPQSDVYYSIIPDKNYFLAEDGGYLHVDYDKMLTLMKDNTSAQYIDIFKTLTIDNYYKGDTHWRQETIENTADTLISAMGKTPKKVSYTENRLENFEGVYADQAALWCGDDLVYLTNKYIDSAEVTCAEHKGKFTVYRPEQFGVDDSYDVFLNGAEAVLYIKRPLFEGEKETNLVLFRDSFGSSITPLLLKNYTNITVVDLRYVSSAVLNRFVNFENADVLFLYNTEILNSGRILK